MRLFVCVFVCVCRCRVCLCPCPYLCAFASTDVVAWIRLRSGDGKLRVWDVQRGMGPDALKEWGSHQLAIKTVAAMERSAGWPGLAPNQSSNTGLILNLHPQP